MSWKAAALLSEQKRIIVSPGEKFSSGCKPGHGWLRVIDSGGNARFYKLPVQDGELHKSVARILEAIAREVAEGHQSIFYWNRSKNGQIEWFNEGQYAREQAALDAEFGG